MNQAYFHLARNLEPLKSTAHRLYGNTESAIAKDFMRINAAAATEGYVWPGNLLFLPEPTCYGPDTDARVIEMVRVANTGALRDMPMEERRFLAHRAAFINNAVNSTQPSSAGMSLTNTATSALFASASLQARVMGDTLTRLERKYIASFRRHGKLTPEFFVERQRYYKTLDSALGRFSRMLSIGTPFDMDAKSALKINSKSQVLRWKRNGVGDSVSDLSRHFETLQKHAKYFKYGGHLTIGIDAALTYDTITKACESSSMDACRKTQIVEGAGFGGRVVGATGGGVVAYAACNLALGAPTLGTSLLWCGVIAGGVAGLASGAIGDQFGRKGGTYIYEKAFPVTP